MPRERNLLVITKSIWRATVHRPGYLDYIGVKRYDAKGNVSGEHRFLGLYTSTAYSAKPADIPLLRSKVARVFERAGFPRGSHAGKSLANILDTYPRDELFQIGEDALVRTALAILKLEGRQRLRVFVRTDLYERFVTCLIFAPRDRYTTELRLRWQKILVEAFNGSASEFAVLLSESRIGACAHHGAHATRAACPRTTSARSNDAWRTPRGDGRTTSSRRSERALGEGRAGPLFRRYAHAFPAAYREDFPARSAVHDIELVEKALSTGNVAINLYRPVDAGPGALRFKVARKGGPVPLSKALPMLERMGLTVIEERPYRITPEGAERAWLHDYGLVAPDVDVDVDEVRPLFEEAFVRMFAGEIKSDDFNRLVLLARLAADDVLVLRAYGRYLRQIGFPLSQTFIEETLASHPAIARMLVALFQLRFEPGRPDDDAAGATGGSDRGCAGEGREPERGSRAPPVRRPDQGDAGERISGEPGPMASGGRSCRSSSIPSPFPACRSRGRCSRSSCTARASRACTCAAAASRAAGCAGPTAPRTSAPRSWVSSRRRSSRTSSSCRSGSKGGFVLKRAPPPSERDAYMKEGVACYQDYLRGPARPDRQPRGGAVVPPPQVRRHDGDDPYLVVAADKGTATFSDYRERDQRRVRVLARRCLRLRGSVGYDHKKMGITARGAWESVKRHFREMGVDVQIDRLRRRRRRRHVGRRVRQRHAAVASHQADRGVRSSARVHRSDAGCGGKLRRA